MIYVDISKPTFPVGKAWLSYKSYNGVWISEIRSNQVKYYNVGFKLMQVQVLFDSLHIFVITVYTF